MCKGTNHLKGPATPSAALDRPERPFHAQVPLGNLHTPGCGWGGRCARRADGEARGSEVRLLSCLVLQRTNGGRGRRLRRVGGESVYSRGVGYHRRRTAPLISQHTGFLNAGARASACAHESALWPARAHGALAQPRHLPFPSEEPRTGRGRS